MNEDNKVEDVEEIEMNETEEVAEQETAEGGIGGGQEPIEGEIATDDGDEADDEASSKAAGIPAPDSIEAQCKQAQTDAAEYRDKWMRGQAEFSNARKRMAKQQSETYAHATADTVKKMLPVWDDLARALDNMPAELEGNPWIEGISMAQRKFVTTLENLNITPIEAVGKEFDPMFHEAIMEEASDEYESGVVSKELQSGYQLGDQVIRPSLVYVAA